MVLGARRWDVLRGTLGMGVRWIALGVLAGVVAIVAAAGILASYVPARRALRVNPMVVLRSE
jgi:ABC-type antimicrobial peptide transport system permease subunit